MSREKLLPYHAKMKLLKINEALIIPWDTFLGGKPKDRKEKSISDGMFSWVCTNTERGLLVMRIA